MRRELEPESEEDARPAHEVGGEEDEERGEGAARRGRAVQRFERVAASMDRILDENPVLDVEDGVTLADERGLEELYAAARGNEDGQRVSGLECLHKLNRALAMLRPALAAGLDGSRPAQHKTYEHLADRVGGLRHHIMQRVYVEAVAFAGGGEPEANEREGDAEGEEEKAKEAAVARVARALSILTDELAFTAGRRRKRPALAPLADAARAIAEGAEDRDAERALEAAVAKVLADPEAAAAGLELEDPGALASALADVREELGEAPEGAAAVDAAARVLAAAAHARGGGAPA